MNTELMQKVLDHIKAHPELHNQGTWTTGGETDNPSEGAWECGTSACIAGWASIFHYDLKPVREEESFFTYDGEKVYYEWNYHLPNINMEWKTEGQSALGISDETADALFLGCGDAVAIRALEDLLAGVDEKVVTHKILRDIYWSELSV